MPIATHDQETVFIDNVRHYYTANDLSALRIDIDGDSFELTLFDEDGAHRCCLDIDEQERVLSLLSKMKRRRNGTSPRGTRP